jgi:signal transduction histidine kinase
MEAFNLGTAAVRCALPRGEAEFRRLLDKLPAGAYTCDVAGRITYYNARAVELWGRAPKLNDGDDRYCGSFRLFDVDGVPIARDRCWMALALAKDCDYEGREIVIERPDGAHVTVLGYASPMHDEQGHLYGAVNVLVDITDRRAAEEALRAAARYKDEFLATLAHELRNPLAPLRNAVQILDMKMPRTAETGSALDVIERQMQHMTRLIDDLMDLSRITRNKIELQRRPARLADIVHAALETSQPLIEAGGHRFTLTMPGEPIMLNADATRLAQALSNLLNNAAKFTPRGGHIALRVERNGNDAVLRVRDTGIGIEPEAMPLIFEMFAQGEDSRERAQGGLGVGLTLVRCLVELHGGAVEARSDGRDRGAEFIVHVPAVCSPEGRGGVEAGGGYSRSTPLLRILVVDDNIDAATTLAALLRMQGHEVRTAHDGIEALELIQNFAPDVAILDIGMPKMNGYTLAARIREIMREAQPLLIAVTGWGQEEARLRSKAAGFDHHLVKPVDPGELVALLAAPSGRTLH